MRQFFGGFLIATFIFLLVAFAQGQQKVSTLTQISDIEQVDLSKVTVVRLPTFTPDDPSCHPFCQTRWGALLIIDGKEYAYSEKADAEVKRLFFK